MRKRTGSNAKMTQIKFNLEKDGGDWKPFKSRTQRPALLLSCYPAYRSAPIGF